MKNNVHEVEINRVLKNSPYNVTHYLPNVKCINREDIINLPRIQKLINKTFGKSIVLTIHTPNEKSFLVYEITKKMAII